MNDAIGQIGAIVVDSRDPVALATFWAGVLGGEPVVNDATWASAKMPPGSIVMDFQEVPETKIVKNRLHIDVHVVDLAAATAACVALGAEPMGSVVEEEFPFQVMLDPEGNEFCLVI